MIPGSTTDTPSLLLVGWDGADWPIANRLLTEGRLEQLQALTQQGVSGPLQSFAPYLSPMLWNTIATGKEPLEHGVGGFTERNPQSGKVQPLSVHSRKTKAIWNILSQRSLRTDVLAWFASHPAESVNGIVVSEAFGKFTTGPDNAAAGCIAPSQYTEALNACRVAPNDVDPTSSVFSFRSGNKSTWSGTRGRAN